MARRVTMSDVARAAGVSLMTVSRVLNNKGDVSAATRQRVQDVICQLGYRPSSVARSLVTSRTRTVGLVVPDNANPFFSELARGVEHTAYASGYSVFLCNTEENADREKAVLQTLEDKRVDGVILCSSRLAQPELRAAIAGFPAAVLVNRELDGDGIDTILVDDELGARLATGHLLERGRRRIGFLSGPELSWSSAQRVKGYEAAFAAANVAHSASWLLPCAPTVEGGRAATRELLQRHPGLTALLCYNDLVAVGAIQGCTDLHLSVPASVCVFGFDDIALAALVTPPLTTCRVSRYDLGCEAMRSLLARFDPSANTAPRRVVVHPELVIRASAP
ncbi:MAG TPA: LacI family DNA-binding transcriptional regulator [Anaerolineae bacterium]|nr:LacI family DNA-binding transcriptional regulator [Anaerolineae bacterium]